MNRATMGTTVVLTTSISGVGFSMLFIIVAMLVIVVLASAVVLYVAFPHRGEEMPHAPWVGDAMRKGVNRLPTIDNQREHQHN